MIRTIVLAIALLACKHNSSESAVGSVGGSGSVGGASPAEVSARSGSAGPFVGSAAPGSGSAKFAPAAAATLKQPKRSNKDSATFSDAEHAFDEAAASARRAKTIKDACAVIDPLEKNLAGLDHVTPPKGFEREFAEARDWLGMKVDYVQSNTCADTEATPDEVAHGLDVARDALNKLESVGAN